MAFIESYATIFQVQTTFTIRIWVYKSFLLILQPLPSFRVLSNILEFKTQIKNVSYRCEQLEI